MANPFTAFAFPASGSNQVNRTLPARIADIKNVKDFGATGGGVTDDWAAIMLAISTITDGSAENSGIIYFPPGTYLVSQPIDFDIGNAGIVNGNVNAMFLGEMGLSIITGNFSDYVFKKTSNFSNFVVFQGLTITNTNANGGGIRGGGGNYYAFRDCVITANRGISTFNVDTPTYLGTLEASIENCVLSPGSNFSGSIGIMCLADGPVINCRVIGFNTGLLTAGGEGAQSILGCYFQQCGTAILLGQGPDGTNDQASGVTIAGCYFKNNSVAIYSPHSANLLSVCGCVIEGTNGQAPSGGNSKYGIQNGDASSKIGRSLFAGITITGQYDNAGMYFPGNSQVEANFVAGCHSVSWNIVPQAGQGSDATQFIACDVAPVFTVAQLGANVEGDLSNVSDGTNGLSWGAIVTNTGSHTSHYGVYWNGTNWTVRGQ